ncbi:MAG: cytidylate kinase family protein [Clostridia bacterium]
MFITLAGTQGGGKSSICKIFVEKYGFEHIKVSNVMRKMAEERGISILEMNQLAETDPSFDKEVDAYTAQIAQQLESENKNAIFDSRMAWHFVPSSVKVFLDANEVVRAERILGDKTRGSVEIYSQLDQTIKSIRERLLSENVRYKKYYHVDNLDMSNYDVVLDSTHKSPEELAEEIISFAKASGQWKDDVNEFLNRKVTVSVSAGFYPRLKGNVITGIVTAMNDVGITIDEDIFLAYSHINDITIVD